MLASLGLAAFVGSSIRSSSTAAGRADHLVANNAGPDPYALMQGLCFTNEGEQQGTALCPHSSHDCRGVTMTMPLASAQKVTARHLQRQAMLYVRQSTLHQVLENKESTARQYALRERAIALGWEISRITTIDQDLGQSGASAVDREGFQRLVAEVGLGQVGLVMGLEVSRLARSSLDWHQLLELCSMTGTLILDEDGLYDPATFNDRLLLGMKGAMSEAELHVLRARLRGGILNQAQRAALKLQLPVGLVYAEDETVRLTPDVQVQQAFQVLFATFKRTGSAWAAVKYFRDQGLLFPRR